MVEHEVPREVVLACGVVDLEEHSHAETPDDEKQGRVHQHANEGGRSLERSIGHQAVELGIVFALLWSTVEIVRNVCAGEARRHCRHEDTEERHFGGASSGYENAQNGQDLHNAARDRFDN
jgi:hypothetical protein